uniref:Auxin-responsive protein SAUR71-like n=1 Tax=Ananas comosus var. bracteatus TaxID=296719 RepID=A0A6V7QY50_ANACO
MKRLMRRISRVADSSEHRPLWKGGEGEREEEEEERGGDRRRRRRRAGGGRVPEGHVPVCVGEEMERFAVRAELLGRPAFVELLRRSAAEYGYEQRGVLRIPCPVPSSAASSSSSPSPTTTTPPPIPPSTSSSDPSPTTRPNTSFSSSFQKGSIWWSKSHPSLPYQLSTQLCKQRIYEGIDSLVV